jgi:hypothetical protein
MGSQDVQSGRILEYSAGSGLVEAANGAVFALVGTDVVLREGDPILFTLSRASGDEAPIAEIWGEDEARLQAAVPSPAITEARGGPEGEDEQ